VQQASAPRLSQLSLHPNLGALAGARASARSIVMSGSGTYAVGPSEEELERFSFNAGDAIFTPAGHVHRFEDFSEDFGTWVVFWGPEGGETSA